MPRTRRRLLAYGVIAIVVITVVLVSSYLGLGSYLAVSRALSTRIPIRNQVSLQGVSLCASNCIYPSPYLSAIMLVNGSVPLSTLRLFINGTDEGLLFPAVVTTTVLETCGTTTVAITLGYAIVVKAQPNNPAMTIVAGKTYTIMVVARFQDNSTFTASVTVAAGSG